MYSRILTRWDSASNDFKFTFMPLLSCRCTTPCMIMLMASTALGDTLSPKREGNDPPDTLCVESSTLSLTPRLTVLACSFIPFPLLSALSTKLGRAWWTNACTAAAVSKVVGTVLSSSGSSGGCNASVMADPTSSSDSRNGAPTQEEECRKL